MKSFIKSLFATTLVGSILVGTTAATLAANQVDNPVVVPFQLIDNRNFIDVMLNGRGPFKVVLDTGCAGEGIIISPEVAKLLGLRSSGKHKVSGAGPGEEITSKAEIADLQISKVHLHNQKTTVMSLDGIQKSMGFAKFDGIIGFSILGRYVTCLDFEKNEITLTLPKNFQKPKSATAVPLTMISNYPFIDAKFGNFSGRFLIDTGDRSSLTIFKRFADSNKMLEDVNPKFEGMTGWGIGGAIPAKVGRFSELCISDLIVHDVVARFPTSTTGVFATESGAGSIGNGVLKRFQINLDYSKKVMWLAPNNRFREDDPYDRSGMWIGAGNNSFLVYDVVPGSPAAKAGIKKDDEILAIDGKPANTIAIDDARKQLRNQPGTSITLQIKTGTSERIVSLQLEDLV